MPFSPVRQTGETLPCASLPISAGHDTASFTSAGPCRSFSTRRGKPRTLSYRWAHANLTYPAGTCIREVELDADTGKIDVVAFHCADDFGNVMNPMIVED